MPGVTQQRKVLVVEDEALMREIVVKKLAVGGFQVIEAVDGKTALDIWEKEKPDLVLLDLILPELDGFEILKIIRNSPDEHVRNTPVVILSNLWTNQDILRAQALKIDGYLVKAYFTTDDILKKVGEILANARPA